MVKGLDIFRVHFQDFADRYVLIGDTACDIAMTGAGLTFRATKDLDIVLCVEALDAAFVEAFWAFVRGGGYQVQEKSTGLKQFYRFQKPTNETYPFMLELFSRQAVGQHQITGWLGILGGRRLAHVEDQTAYDAHAEQDTARFGRWKWRSNRHAKSKLSVNPSTPEWINAVTVYIPA